jgi:hypothetical protein
MERLVTEVDIRAAMLTVIERLSRGGNLQSGTVLREAAMAVFNRRTDDLEDQALLTQFYELFRTGYLAWGLNISNPDPPFFHLTEQGRKTLAKLSSDPGNPAGYRLRLDAVAPINSITGSYLDEALRCYVADLNKAAAVMVGAASESLILELRDEVEQKLSSFGRPISKDLRDWRVSRVLLGLKGAIDSSKASLARSLRDEYESYWPAFTQQIRAARNDAGHPTSVDPITSDTVHASLLIFPELLRVATELRKWVRTWT